MPAVASSGISSLGRLGWFHHILFGEVTEPYMKIWKFALLAFAIAICASTFGTGTSAFAAQHRWTHIRVTAKVDPSCVNFWAQDLYFGTIPAFPPYSVQSSNYGTISYKCTLGTNVVLTGHGDCRNPSDSDTYWSMCDYDHGKHYIDYAMYMSGSYVVESGGGCGPSTSNQEQPYVPFSNNETDFPFIDAGSGYQDSTQHLCAQIPTDPSPATGAIWVGNHTARYTDRVTLTIWY